MPAPFLPSALRVPAALAAALLLGLGVQLALPAPQGAGPLPPAPHRPPALAAPPAPLDTFAAVTARPVFSPDRTAAGEAGAGVAREGQLVLVGVGSGPGGGSATLQTPGSGLQTVAIGQAVQGWRLLLTSADAAVLERDGVRQVLRLGVPAGQEVLASIPPIAGPPPSPPSSASPAPPAPPPFSVHGSR